jgi:hypothetical protein
MPRQKAFTCPTNGDKLMLAWVAASAAITKLRVMAKLQTIQLSLQLAKASAGTRTTSREFANADSDRTR